MVHDYKRIAIRDFDRRRKGGLKRSLTGQGPIVTLAGRIDDRDLVPNALDARYMTNSFLHQLFQVKSWQTTRQAQHSAALLDAQHRGAPPKVGVPLQRLPGERGQVAPFGREGWGPFRYGRWHVQSPAKCLGSVAT
jgi:hypothetical protein